MIRSKLVQVLAVLTTATAIFIGATAQASITPKISSWHPELGFDVIFGDGPLLSDKQEISKASQVFAYSASLGANAVALNFNFYEVGQSPSHSEETASAVQSGTGTPSPQLLSSIIILAESYGLKVQLRPLLSEEGDVANISARSTISPTDPVSWFHSYEAWLKPYLYVAAADNVTSISIGSELGSLVTAYPGTFIGAHNFLPEWLALTQFAGSIYHGSMLYAASHATTATVPGVGFGFDAYTAISLPSGSPHPTGATPLSTVIAEFTPGITKNYQLETPASPGQTRIEEMGLPAVDNAWLTPSEYAYFPTPTVQRWVQEAWITANCNVFISKHMLGLYIWGISLNSFSPTYNADTAADPYNFQGTASEASISSCFSNAKVG